MVSKSIEQGCDTDVKNFIEKYAIADKQRKETMTANILGNLQDDLQATYSIKNKVITSDTSKYDLNVVFYYANFMGKITKNNLKSLHKQIAKSQLKANVILLNCDVQQKWNDSLQLNLKTAK